MAVRPIWLVTFSFLVAILLAGCNNARESVSSDGNQVAVSHGGVLWVADTKQEAWTKLAVDGGRAESPSWSADGRRVLAEIVPKPAEGSSNDVSVPDVDIGYAALYDNDTKTVSTLADSAHAPFLWMPDGQPFVATTISKEVKREDSPGLT
jgi:Tol biopolymer transport system component